jgi:uncharacterized membrane protein
MYGSVSAVLIATAAFVGSHFLLSHPLRAPLVKALGEKPFSGLYSIVAAMTFIWMVYAYSQAPLVVLWSDVAWTRILAWLLMAPAVLLLVCGLSSDNPTLGPLTSVTRLAAGARGALAITRHPLMWGIALWAIGHILANGDSATVIMAGGNLILAVVGALAIDARKQAELGEAYKAFMARTSFVPFAALASGRTRLSAADLGWHRIGIAIVLYVALAYAHRWIAGVPLIG